VTIYNKREYEHAERVRARGMQVTFMIVVEVGEGEGFDSSARHPSVIVDPDSHVTLAPGGDKFLQQTARRMIQNTVTSTEESTKARDW